MGSKTTYSTAADRAKNIRKALKAAHGWTGRQVSVRCSSFSMGSSVSVYIKDVDIPLDVVQKIAEEHADTNGSSRFLHVSYETGTLDDLAALLTDEIATAIETGSKVIGLFDVHVSGHELRIFVGEGRPVEATAGCENTAATAAHQLCRIVAAKGILSGWAPE